MWRLLYRAVLLAAWPWVHLRLRWRARSEPGYGERVGERFGRVPPQVAPGSVWFHTVSAGETIAAAPLIAGLAERFPELPFLVTTMTPTGSEQARRRLAGVAAHCYAPYDFPRAVRRFYDRVRPRLLVLMETELWPNLVEEAWRRDVPVLLVNARLSARSARGYGRLGGFAATLLGRLRWIACQYPDHARRFVELGAPPERVLVHGSVKFDVVLPDDHAARVAELRRRFGLADPPGWIAASTHPGEEAQVLEAHRLVRARLPQARLILVPRHPSRATEVAELCRRRGFEVGCLSAAPGTADGAVDVILGDTMGELLYLYGLAAAAFVGGSLVDRGGHNPIEPALCALPVAMGPADFNFPEVAAVLRVAGCLHRVDTPAALAERMIGWLGDPAAARRQGAAGPAAIGRERGATARLQALLSEEIQAAAAAQHVARD